MWEVPPSHREKYAWIPDHIRGRLPASLESIEVASCYCTGERIYAVAKMDGQRVFVRMVRNDAELASHPRYAEITASSTARVVNQYEALRYVSRETSVPVPRIVAYQNDEDVPADCAYTCLHLATRPSNAASGQSSSSQTRALTGS